MDRLRYLEKVYEPALAATLVLQHFKPLYTGMEPEGRFVFGFKKSEGLLETIDAFWENSLNVHPMEFYDTVQVIIGVAHGARQLG